MVFTIFITPFWSAYTDAYSRNDMDWIKKSLLKMRKLWALLILSTVLLFLASAYIFRWWIGDSVTVPISLSLALALYVIVYTWQTIHVFLLNGIGKIKLQLYFVVISALVNIPLAFFLGKRIGLAGVSLANTLLFIIMGIVFYIQVSKIINKKAKGIWNA